MGDEVGKVAENKQLSLKAMETTKDLGRGVTWVFLHGVFSNDGPFGDSVGLETLSNPTESVCVPSLEQWRRKILLSKISETLCLIRCVQWKESRMSLGFLI